MLAERPRSKNPERAKLNKQSRVGVSQETTAQGSLKSTVQSKPEIELANITSVEARKPPVQPHTTIENGPQIGQPVAETPSRAITGKQQGNVATYFQLRSHNFPACYSRGCARLARRERTEIYKAIDDFTQALSHSAALINPAVYCKRSLAFQLIGRYHDAILDYSRYIQHHRSQQDKGYLSRGLAYSELQDYEKALADIQHANNRCRSPSLYYLCCLAQAQDAAGRTTEARESYTQVVTMSADASDPPITDSQRCFYRGIAQYRLNDYRAALESFERAREDTLVEQKQAEINFHIGLAQYALSDHDGAKQSFERVLRQDPNHARAALRLGMMHKELEDSPEEALAYLNEAHRLAPHQSEILYERGELHYRMGRLGPSISDKRRALQLEGSATDTSTMRLYYESLLQQLLATMKARSALPSDLYFMFMLLVEKMNMLSQNTQNASMSSRHYDDLLTCSEKVIESEPNGIYAALTFANLHHVQSDRKCVVSSKFSFDQLNYILDTNAEAAKVWDDTLARLKALEKRQSVSGPETVRLITELIGSQNLESGAMKETIKKIFEGLLADKCPQLLKIDDFRSRIKADEQHFTKDLNGNRLTFYRSLRCDLSRKFTAMTVVSCGKEDKPIIAHDYTGTLTAVADGLEFLSGILGSALPVGGAVAGFVISCIGKQLKEKEYAKYQDRMTNFVDEKDSHDLEEIARQVARELADRYEEQLLRVYPIRSRLAKRKWFPSRTRVGPSKSEVQSTNETCLKSICNFAITAAVQSIVDGKYRKMCTGVRELKKNSTAVSNLVELVCRAEPNFNAKVLRQLKIHKREIIPHFIANDPESEDQQTVWYLYDFYRMPGIYVTDELNTKTTLTYLSWTDSSAYGHRLGTQEEHERLVELDKKRKRSILSRICCCRK